MPGRRHVVADRDRRHHDQPASGLTTLKPGERDVPAPRRRRRHRRPRRQLGRDPRRGLPRAHPAVAVDAARHLGRSRALPRDVLEPVPWPVLPGRRRQARRRGLLLAARSGRRRDARLRPQHLHRRGASTRSSGTLRSPRPRSWAAPTRPRARRRRVRDPAFATSNPPRSSSPSFATTSAHTIGPIAKPKTILFTEDLPKTRSGKIMRRLLKDVSEDQALGDTTTLADPGVVESIKARYLDASRQRRGVKPPPGVWRRRNDPGWRNDARARQLELARPARSSPAAPPSSTSTACSPTRPSRQHYLEAAAPGLAELLRRVR